MGRLSLPPVCSLLCLSWLATAAGAQARGAPEGQADEPPAAGAEESTANAEDGAAPEGSTAIEAADAEPAQPLEKVTVIVPGFGRVGEVSDGELDTVTGLVVYQVSKVKRLEIITEADIQEMLALEAQRSAIGCSEESSCLNEIADALGADLILTGKVGKLGPRYLIQLTLIDTAQAKPIAREQLQVRSVTQVGAEVIGAVHALTESYGGLPNIEEAKRSAEAADSRTSYAGRFVEFATEPDTVMLFAMLAGGLFALVVPVFWIAPIVQAVLLWWLGDDIAGREYPRWWLAIPAGWAVYLAAFVVAAATSGVAALSTYVAGGLGLAGGGGIALSGAGGAVLMIFMLEPVVAWWAGTWGARDVALFTDVDEEGGEGEPGQGEPGQDEPGQGEPGQGEADPSGVADDNGQAALWPRRSTPPMARVQGAVARTAAWARSGAQ